MKTSDFSNFIETYTAGEMSDSEKQWFLNEISGNEKLLKEVKLRKHTDVVLENQNVILLRNKLSGIERSREADIHTRKAMKPVFMKFVAVIAGVLIIGSITLFTGKNLTSDEIINRYYKEYEFPLTQRSGQSETISDFTQALEFYNTHQYGKAAILFSKVLDSNPSDMQSELLYGISNFGENKYPEAKQSFVKVIDDNNNLFIEDAKYYLALCYVKTNERVKAIKQFEIIKKEGGIYSKKAKMIIRRFK